MDKLVIVDLSAFFGLLDSKLRQYSYEITSNQMNIFAQYLVGFFEMRFLEETRQGIEEDMFLYLSEIPSELWDEVKEYIRDDMFNFIWNQKMLSHFCEYKGVGYDFKFMGYSVLTIRCFSEGDKPIALEDMTLKEIKKGIDKGDFFPEDIRTIVRKYT